MMRPTENISTFRLLEILKIIPSTAVYHLNTSGFYKFMSKFLITKPQTYKALGLSSPDFLETPHPAFEKIFHAISESGLLVKSRSSPSPRSTFFTRAQQITR
jgi:hypothetical protein